jgi:filamentous hemagglutinin family protein
LPNGQVQGPEGANANVVSINLISQNAPDYTVPVNENFLYLLENFASTVGGIIDGPDKAIQGQLWYDTSTTPGLLKINDSTTVDSPDWQVVSPQIAGNLGELQFNDGTDQLTATNNMTYVAANATLVLSNVASTGNADIAGELIVAGNANVTLNVNPSMHTIKGNITFSCSAILYA